MKLDSGTRQDHVFNMNKHLQIRNLSASTHRKLKARAASQGMSMSDYVRIEIERLLSSPSPKEWLEMVRKRQPMTMSVEDAVAATRHSRDENDRKFDSVIAKRR